MRRKMIRCSRAVEGTRCARVAAFVGFDEIPDYVCEPCQQGGKPYVPRAGRPGQQKQTKRK